MKISRVVITEKSYEGISYKEYSIFCLDRFARRLFTTTGKTPVVYVDSEGTLLMEETRLDKVELKPNDEVVFWLDHQNKVKQIDVIIPDVE